MLKEQQNNVMYGIINAIDEGHNNIILRGSAGVGKTYLVQHLIENFRKLLKRKGIVYITAPTNKAVAVLEDKAEEFDNYLYRTYLTEAYEKHTSIMEYEQFKAINRNFREFKTVHSSLYLKRQINDKTGEISFVPEWNPKKEMPFAGADLIIIDESSMIESRILYYLESPQYAHIPKIYLGDDKQLNPVGEEDSPIFLRSLLYNTQIGQGITKPFIEILIPEKNGIVTKKHYLPKYVEFELTEIIRQGEGNPIIDLSRNIFDIGKRQSMVNTKGEGYTYTKDFEGCIDKVIKDPENIRYLAWTNAEVDRVNTLIRQKIYTVPSKLMMNELIVIGTAYTGIDGTIYSTNSEHKITFLEVKEEPFGVIVEYDWQSPSDDMFSIPDTRFLKNRCQRQFDFIIKYYLVNNNIMIIHEDSEFVFHGASRKLRDYTKIGMSWKTWFSFVEQFCRFNYPYALTVHKSQGSTYHTSIINMKDLNRNRNEKELKRLWYTGVTRAAKNILIYEPPYSK